MKIDIATKTAPRLYSWLSHSAVLVNSVAEGWRICRQVGTISTILEKERAMPMKVR